MTRRGRRVGKGHRAGTRAAANRRVVALFLLPFGLLFLGLYVAPIGYALVQSLYQVKRSGLGLGPARTVFAGLANYARVFADSTFVQSVGRVLLFGVVQVPVMLGLALLLALLLDSAVARFPRFFRVAYFLPYALPGVIAALLWSFLYAPGISPYQKLLAGIGVNIDFVSSNVVLWSIANIVTWTYTGYNMLVIFSALQAIPRDLYEAARLDGCSGWRIAWHVKIPLVRSALVLTTVFSIIGTLQLFNEPSIIQHIAPAVTNRYTPLMLAQTVGLNNGDYNFAAAASVVLALATFVLSFGFLRVTQRKGRG